MTGKSRVVTFRMDQATWDFMRELVPYTRYRKASSFIRGGIENGDRPRSPRHVLQDAGEAPGVGLDVDGGRPDAAVARDLGDRL